MSDAGDSEWERGGDDAVAAEYVLGALDAAERRTVAARIEVEQELARLVDRWELMLAPMASAYAEVEPPASVRQALEKKLFTTAPSTRQKAGLWQNLAFWRGLTVAALGALALFVAVPVLAPPDAAPPPRLVASLAPQDSDVQYMAMYDPAIAEVGLSHMSGARAEGRDFELWMIEGDDPPHSLGVIPEGEAIRMALDDVAREKMARGAVFAVSLEPLGGSPTGAPTGPVVAAGDLREI